MFLVQIAYLCLWSIDRWKIWMQCWVWQKTRKTKINKYIKILNTPTRNKTRKYNTRSALRTYDMSRASIRGEPPTEPVYNWDNFFEKYHLQLSFKRCLSTLATYKNCTPPSWHLIWTWILCWNPTWIFCRNPSVQSPMHLETARVEY